MKNNTIRFAIIYLIMQIITVFAFGNNLSKEQYLQSHSYKINKDVESRKIFNKYFEDVAYYKFIKESIPEKFVLPFFQFTKDNKNLGIEILGIAKHESNWKWFRGKMNENGSVDLGPLMLNSFNIQDKSFMKYFANNCEEYIYDLDIYYMLICINYYKNIRINYGPWHALQIYNGGYRAIRRSASKKLKTTVTKYANTVYKYINQYTKNWKEFKETYYKDYEKHIQNFNLERNNKVFMVCMSNPDILESFYSHIEYNRLVYNHDKKYYKLFILQKWDYRKLYYTNKV